VGSGSLPVEIIPSMALICRATSAKAGSALKHLASDLRKLPIPVIGRIAEDALVLDLRCMEDEAGFVAQLGRLAGRGSA
jgi:L-seryl-tRNA(Ser) seleniumtransferase